MANRWLVFGLPVGDLRETKKRNAALSHREGKHESLQVLMRIFYWDKIHDTTFTTMTTSQCAFLAFSTFTVVQPL